ncbi:MAG TPA: lectin [Methylomirabilota bacterium]
MRKTTHILAALALSALAMTVTFAQRDGGGQRGGGGAPGGGGQGGGGARGPQQPMSFFITSVGKGDGANYGGIAGADAYCQQMATGAGRGGATWHAYLSTQGAGAVNARDRIGNGPWYNARGQMIAMNNGALHGDTIDQARVGNALGKQVSFTEKNTVVNGVGDMPNTHDILTGSRPDGTAYTDGMDHTCSNYTSSADGMGQVQLGHADKQGGGNSSWNSAHGSRGCSQPNLVATGGAGLLYCFAVN